MTEENERPRNSDERANGSGAGRRRPYSAPVLTRYGSIARLTRTGGSTAKESGVPQMKKNCL